MGAAHSESFDIFLVFKLSKSVIYCQIFLTKSQNDGLKCILKIIRNIELIGSQTLLHLT